jgi:hypothetical protein
MTWAIRASDNFNRANEDPIQAPWILGTGGIGRLLNNTWATKTGSYDYSTYNLALANDHKVTVKATQNSPPASIDVLGLRSDDLNVQCGVAVFANNTCTIYVNGVQLGLSFAAPYLSGEILEFQVIGQQLSTYTNGVLRDTRAAPTINASGKVFIGSNRAAPTQTFDDFIVSEWVSRPRFKPQIL